jgi:nucleoside-diphosphate-sugar epimerase
MAKSATANPGRQREHVVVVTGASGFLGRAVCAELAARGAVVYGVSRTACGSVPGIRFHHVREYGETPTPAGARCIHLAGNNNTQNIADRVEAERNATLQLAGRLATAGFARVIYASSAQVYGDQIEGARRENEPVSPATPYAKIKRAAEEVFLAHGHLVARIANVYGAGMSTANVLSDLLRQIPGEGPIRVHDTTPVRDYIHVRDVARGLAHLVLREGAGIFNLGTGIGTSVGELAALLLKQVGEQGRSVIPRDKRPSWVVVDPRKMKATFGWEPTIHLVQGLEDLRSRRERVLAG